MKNIMLKTKKISVSTWKEFQEILLKKEINCELEWRKRRFFTKPCLPEESNYIKIFLVAKNGEKKHIMTVTSTRIYMAVRKCDTDERNIIFQALKDLELAIFPSLLIPVILSSIHYVVLIGIILDLLANIRYYSDAEGYIALFITSFIFILLGTWRLHTSVHKKGSISELGRVFFIMGCLLTTPSACLQVPLFHAYVQKCSFLFVNKHDEK